MCLILAGAAWTDVWEGKIRNSWLFLGAAFGVWCRGRAFFPGAAAVLVPSFLLFRLGMMGAGDGKLMAVVAGYLGAEAGIAAIGAGLAVGALWSLYRLRHGQGLKTRLVRLFLHFAGMFQTGRLEKYCDLSQVEKSCTVPLAACMAAGTYLYLMVSGAAALGRG